MSVKISSLNTASTINSGDDINIAGNNPLYFSDWGGGWYMQDGTWMRNYAKSLWIGSGVYGTDGGLTIGYGGGAPPSAGAIIAGLVGIGTSSPAYKLQVRPSATFGNSEDGNISIWSSFGGGGTVTNPSTVGGIIFGDENTLNSYQGRIAVIANDPSATTAAHMRFYTNAGGGNGATAERMRIAASGNLLIGTTTDAGYKLDVNGSARVSGLFTIESIYQVSRFVSTNTVLYNTYRANGTDVGYIGNGEGLISGGTATSFGIRAESDLIFAIGNATKFSIANSGAATFSSSVTANGLLNNSYSIGTSSFGIDSVGSTKVANGLLFRFGAISSVTNGFTATLNSSNNGINYSFDYGNVGIGTTSPAKKLHIKGGDDDVLFLDNGGQQYTTQYFANNGTTKSFLGWDNTNSIFTTGTAVAGIYAFLTNNAERMRIASGGNVLIGTTTDAGYKLYVNGTGRFSNDLVAVNGTTDSLYSRITSPGGGTSLGNAPIASAIKIALPADGSFLNTMISFTIHIYNYSAGTSRTIKVGGYSYFDTSWYNTFTYQSGGSQIDDINIRFGTEGGCACVWIGETTTYWHYPNIFITDVQVGHSQSSNLTKGWNVSLVSSFGTVQSTIVAYENITTYTIGSQSVSYATTAGALTSMLISQFTNDSGYVTSSALAAYLPLAGGTLTGALIGTSAVFNSSITSGATGASNGSFTIKRASDGLSVANLSIDNTISIAKLYTEYSLLSFSTDGTERARFSSGNLLIGTTTNAGYRLDVNGDARVAALRGTSASFAGTVNFAEGYGLNGFSDGTGDGASFATYNFKLTGWSSMAFYNPTTGGAYPNQVSGLIDFRNGIINMKGGFSVNGSVVLYAGNYNSYAPTLTGTGASGTWGISITGNANYATTAGALTSMNISQFTNNSGYLTSASLAGYLPLTGGTLTGDLTTSGWFINSTNNYGIKNSSNGSSFWSSYGGWTIESTNTSSTNLVFYTTTSLGAQTEQFRIGWANSIGIFILNDQGADASIVAYQGAGYGGYLTGTWNVTNNLTVDGDGISVNNSGIYDTALIGYQVPLHGDYCVAGMIDETASGLYVIRFNDFSYEQSQLKLYPTGDLYIYGQILATNHNRYFTSSYLRLSGSTAANDWFVKQSDSTGFSIIKNADTLSGISTAGTHTFSSTSNLLATFTDSGSTFGVTQGNYARAYFHVTGSAGATHAMFGTTYPLLFGSNYPTVYYNMYYSSGWKIASGTSVYGGATVYDPVNGIFYWYLTGTAANADGTVTPSIQFRIDRNGQVSIGNTASSTHKLYVTGTTYLGGNVGVLGYVNASNLNASTLTTNGLVYSNGGTLTNINPSDLRLKEDINPLQYGLKEVMALNPVTYKWKDGSNGGQRSTGLIAQDVKEVMPDYVKNVSEDSDLLGLDSYAINIVLINAIKELKAEIEILKNK